MKLIILDAPLRTLRVKRWVSHNLWFISDEDDIINFNLKFKIKLYFLDLGECQEARQTIKWYV